MLKPVLLSPFGIITSLLNALHNLFIQLPSKFNPLNTILHYGVEASNTPIIGSLMLLNLIGVPPPHKRRTKSSVLYF